MRGLRGRTQGPNRGGRGHRWAWTNPGPLSKLCDFGQVAQPLWAALLHGYRLPPPWGSWGALRSAQPLQERCLGNAQEQKCCCFCRVCGAQVLDTWGQEGSGEVANAEAKLPALPRRQLQGPFNTVLWVDTTSCRWSWAGKPQACPVVRLLWAPSGRQLDAGPTLGKSSRTQTGHPQGLGALGSWAWPAVPLFPVQPLPWVDPELSQQPREIHRIQSAVVTRSACPSLPSLRSSIGKAVRKKGAVMGSAESNQGIPVWRPWRGCRGGQAHTQLPGAWESPCPSHGHSNVGAPARPAQPSRHLGC